MYCGLIESVLPFKIPISAFGS